MQKKTSKIKNKSKLVNTKDFALYLIQYLYLCKVMIKIVRLRVLMPSQNTRQQNGSLVFFLPFNIKMGGWRQGNVDMIFEIFCGIQILSNHSCQKFDCLS